MAEAGTVLAVFPDRKSYMVLLDNGIAVTASNLETGTDFTVLRHNRVACCKLRTVGWKVIGKFRTPVNKEESDEQQKTIAQRIAEEQSYLNRLLTGQDLDQDADFLEEGEDPLLEGEVALKSLINKSSISIFNDGSIVSRVTDVLLFMLSKAKNVALISAKRLIIRLVPGVKVDVGLKEDGTTQNPNVTVKPKVRALVTLASDPDKPTNQDLFLEAGDIDKNAAQYGASTKTQKSTLVRGLRFLMENFSIAEVDNDKGEMRLTYIQTPEKADPQQQPFQIRMNDDEVVLSWGSQFISLTSKGLMIKADRIGLAGPVDMWDPSKVQGFKQDTGFPTPLTPDPVTIEWYAQGQPAGIRIAKSVYFGDEKEPAILKGFFENRYQKDMQAVFEHVHVSPTSGGTTTPMAAQDPEFYPTVLLGTTDPLVIKMLSLITIPG
jgi:hypothetical protein